MNLADVQKAAQAANQQAFKDAIQQAVQSGKITQDQADWLLKGLDNGWLGKGGMHGFGGFRMGKPNEGGQQDPATPGTQGGTSFQCPGRAPRQAPSFVGGGTF